MPMEQPWRTAFAPGDYIFGYASSIIAFIEAHKGEGATTHARIQALDTDRVTAPGMEYEMD